MRRVQLTEIKCMFGLGFFSLVRPFIASLFHSTRLLLTACLRNTNVLVSDASHSAQMISVVDVHLRTYARTHTHKPLCMHAYKAQSTECVRVKPVVIGVVKAVAAKYIRRLLLCIKYVFICFILHKSQGEQSNYHPWSTKLYS